MTLKEVKESVLELIEEINPNSELLTDDPDISAKINGVINHIQFELARMKKIATSAEEEVSADEPFDMTLLPDFYQLRLLRFKNASGEDKPYETVENMVIFSEDGTATFYYYKYPTRITKETADDYEFELSQDTLEILPYGVAGDLLKSDVSSEYGAIYSQRYEQMLQRLDPRYSMSSVYVEGGVNI